MSLSLLDGFADVLAQPFMPDRAVVTLPSRGRRHRLPGNGCRHLVGVGAIVNAYCAGFAAPFDDAVKASSHAAAGKEKSTSMPNPSRLKSSSTFKSRNAREGGHVRCLCHRQRIGFAPLQPLAGFDLLPGNGLPSNDERAQIQLKLGLDAVNPLVSPRVPVDVAQVQKA